MRSEEIPIRKIAEPQVRLRVGFDPEALEELRRSIAEVGLLQPIVVAKVEDGYEIIAGHRRLLACQSLGWETIPAIIIDAPSVAIPLLSLTENVLREELTPIEEAATFRYLVDECAETVSSIAQRLGKDHAYVSRRLKLLELEPRVQQAIHVAELNATAALYLDRIKEPETRNAYYSRAIQSGVSVRQAAQWAEDAGGPPSPFRDTAATTITQAPAPTSPLTTQTCFICDNVVEYAHLTSAWVCSECLRRIQVPPG